MNTNNRVKKMIIAALLISIAVIIPLQFGFLKIYIPPFSATIASHVPMFIAMIISPKIALLVGAGSTLGFLITLGVPVALRASSHIVVGYIGGVLFRKYRNLKMPVIITAPIHGILEGLAVIPFIKDGASIILITIVGTILHHFLDAFISFIIIKSMSKGKDDNLFVNFTNKFLR